MERYVVAMKWCVSGFLLCVLLAGGCAQVQLAPKDRAALEPRAIDAGLWGAPTAVSCERRIARQEMRRRDQRLDDAPVVIVAFSAGAMGAPSVAVFRADLYDALVLVCGGANIASVLMRSTFRSPLDFEGERGYTIPDTFFEAFDEAYLVALPLDPYHTAPALVDVPVLMLHGRSDTWVPADTGDLFLERLGRPERWKFWGGHRLVFWRLPSLAQKSERWAREATTEEDAR